MIIKKDIEIIYENRTEYAEPITPNLGIKIIFRAILDAALAKEVIIVHLVKFSIISIVELNIAINTKMLEKICILRILAEY
jgi:hypothetical protein